MLNEICKEVTDIPGEYLVNPKCQCPRDHSCPTVSPKHVETVQYDQQVYFHSSKQGVLSLMKINEMLQNLPYLVWFYMVYTRTSNDLKLAVLLKPLPVCVSLKKYYQNMLLLVSIYDFSKWHFFHTNWPTVCAFMLFVKLKPCIQNVHIPLVILMTSHTSTSNWWRRVYNARMHFKFPLQNMDVVPTSKSIDNGKGAKVCHSYTYVYLSWNR